MKNHRFYNSHVEMKKIFEERHVTVDVATPMYITKHSLENDKSELTAWTNLCTQYRQDPKLALAGLFR